MFKNSFESNWKLKKKKIYTYNIYFTNRLHIYVYMYYLFKPIEISQMSIKNIFYDTNAKKARK